MKYPKIPEMKYPKKIAAIALVAVLGVVGLTAATWAVSGGHWVHSAWAKHDKHEHHGGKHGGCERDGHDMHHGPRPFDSHELAKKLTVMETEIGIRADQIDAWRDFTDALLATMAPPMGPGPKGPDAMLPSDGAPFYLAEHFADRAIARGENAEKLKQAITQLRTTLTAEQLEKVKEIEAQIRARIHGHHEMGPPPHDGPPAMESDSGDDDAMDQPDSDSDDEGSDDDAE